MTRAIVSALLLVALLAPSGTAHAQQVSLQAPEGPEYLGAPIELRVVASGFQEEPPPEISVVDPDQGRLELVGVQPRVSQSLRFVNGQLTQSKQVEFAYVYRFVPARAGRFELGPFVVSQGDVRRTTRPVVLEVREVPLSDRVRVVLSIREGPAYVGERIPVTLEFWLEKKVRENLHHYTLQVPLFSQGLESQFIDEPAASGDTDVKILTPSGELRLRGKLRQVRSAGRDYVVVSVLRTLVPLREGAYELEPATLIVDEATHWKRDFFGGRRATRVRKLRATGRPRKLEVRAVPLRGKPASFAGAVGRGFHLEVSADRTVVQVGEPIRLSLVLAGEGNLESVGLPRLDAEGLLSPADFRVPDADLTGVFDGSSKRFAAMVRVLDENVREIPALEYAWFDAERGEYQTTRSRPIALSVRPAEIIAADDVFSSAPAAKGSGATGPDSLGQDAERSPSVELTGADLAIERRIAVLVRAPGSLWAGGLLSGGVYAGTSLLVLAALWDRRRRGVDPALLSKRRVLEAQLRRIREARALGTPPPPAILSDALRRMLAEVPDARTGELDVFLGECDALTYAPEGRRRAGEAEQAFGERAERLAEELRGWQG